SGSSANGAVSSSGSGSTVTTIMAPERSSGKVRPGGAFCRKSSPGKGGAIIEPENGADESAPLGIVNFPVERGWPATTAHPSYFHPAVRIGSDKPAAGLPELRSMNHTPLFSLLFIPSVGVARMYLPLAAVKSLPSAMEPEIPNMVMDWPLVWAPAR